ncbi:MAG: WD40 repeat/WD40 repeat [Verrucomicrobia bacterium]|nr:MAG: WD40 repeat/WD40 repeat [Verrucomicrobiota bacterium]
MRRIATSIILASLCTLPVYGAEARNFEDHILPLLREHCANCHRPGKTRGGLDVTTMEKLEKGGSAGPAVISGLAENSPLFRAISHIGNEEAMPPEQDKLPPHILAAFKLWIEGGLKPTASGLARESRAVVQLTVDAATLGAPATPPVFIRSLPPRADAPQLVRGLPVMALAANPWAPIIAVGGQDETVLHDLSDGHRIGALPFAAGEVRVLRFSRNGQVLLVGGGRPTASGKVQLVELQTGKSLTTVGDDFDVVLAADLSPDQSLVATAGPEKLVRVYRVADGVLVWTLKRHADFITSLEFSPDGKHLASADRAGGIFITDASKGENPRLLAGATDAVNQLAWRSDARSLAAACGDGQALLYDPASARLVAKWAAHEGGCLSIAYSREGSLLTGGHDASASLWKESGDRISQFKNCDTAAFRVGFTSAQNPLVGDWSGDVREWTPEGYEVRVFSARVRN